MTRSQSFPNETAASDYCLDMEQAGWQVVGMMLMPLAFAVGSPTPWVVHLSRPDPVPYRDGGIGREALAEVSRQLGYGDGPMAPAAVPCRRVRKVA